MKIAIDVSPLQNDNKVRGVGFYLEHLKNSLVKYFPENNYVFFQRGEKLPDDIDLVHFPYFEPFFLALPIYKKYKTVVTVHDLTPIVFPNAFPKGIKGELKWQMQKFSLRKANAIITDSESSKKDIVKHVGVPAERVSVIYLAAGEEFKKLEISPDGSFHSGSRTNEIRRGNWKLEIKRKYGLPDHFLLYVGDVTWNKNLPRLVEAARKSRIPLVMVGKALISEDFDKKNPWNQDLVTVQNSVKEDKNIILPGFVETADLVQIYNLATFLIMPSLYEGFGLPILEAMACGCPVITTKEGSIPEVAGDAAFYTNAYDSEKIAKDITEVFEDEKLRKELSAAGFKQLGKFSWKKTAEKTARLYTETIRNE